MRKPTLLLLLGMLLVPLQWAQTTGTAQQLVSGEILAAGAGPDDIPTIHKTVEEVNVIFTATDKRGRFKKT